MSTQHYSILTAAGEAFFAQAVIDGTAIVGAEFKIAVGNGHQYEPIPEQTSLKGEKWRSIINDIYTNPDDASQIVIEGVIPTNVGGWFIREWGVFNGEGQLIAVGSLDDTYKSPLSSGVGKQVFIQAILNVDNAVALSIIVDDSVVIASKQYVDKVRTELLVTSNRGISTSDIGSRLAVGESIKVVVYGDSTVDGTNTTGWTANPTDSAGNAIGGTDHNLSAPNSWPVFMQRILRDMFGNGVTVKNAGYGGKGIVDNWAVRNYQKAVIDTYGTPDFVFISFGLNDVVQGIYTTDLFYQRYSELIDKVLDSGAGDASN